MPPALPPEQSPPRPDAADCGQAGRSSAVASAGLFLTLGSEALPLSTHLLALARVHDGKLLIELHAHVNHGWVLLTLDSAKAAQLGARLVQLAKLDPATPLAGWE